MRQVLQRSDELALTIFTMVFTVDICPLSANVLASLPVCVCVCMHVCVSALLLMLASLYATGLGQITPAFALASTTQSSRPLPSSCSV